MCDAADFIALAYPKLLQKRQYYYINAMIPIWIPNKLKAAVAPDTASYSPRIPAVKPCCVC